MQHRPVQCIEALLSAGLGTSLLVAALTASCSSGSSSARSTTGGTTTANVADAGPDGGSTAIDGGVDAALASTGGVDCAGDTGRDGVSGHLACTGLFADWRTGAVGADVMAYTPAYGLWSDGADKRRWIALPPGAQIDTTNMDDWIFPDDTKVWKEFSVGGKRIETRLMWKRAGIGWFRVVYRWSADEATAVRLDGGEKSANGTTYDVPSTSTCPTCHAGRTDNVLGFDAVNLGSARASGATLAVLASRHLLTTAAPASLEIPDDGTGKARDAIGWMHSNCGVSCHNRNPKAVARGTGLFLEVDANLLLGADGGTPSAHDLDVYRTAVGVPCVNASFAAQGDQRILPGRADASTVVLFAASRAVAGVPSMPPILSSAVDTEDVAVVSEWIAALPPAVTAGPDAAAPDAGAPDASAALDAVGGLGATE